MTTKQINKQINLQKMHNARTKRAFKNINIRNKLYAQYGGIYTQNELNLLRGLTGVCGRTNSGEHEKGLCVPLNNWKDWSLGA